MKLKIIWMYHDLMDLYGDRGNIQVLKIRCEKRGIACQIDICGIGDKIDFMKYDLFFLGGGADREQSLIFEDLLKRKEEIKKAVMHGLKCLLICGGYQLFGQYYKDQDGKKIDGLGLFDYYTEATSRKQRCIGNIMVETQLNGKKVKVVGFENHSGQTFNVSHPFGQVLSGHGNSYQSQWEGYLDENVLATYIHGPLLPKNPKIADYIITKALKKNYGDIELEELDDTMENKAQDVILKRIESVQNKKQRFSFLKIKSKS